MNLVLVVLWSLAMPYDRFRSMASCLSTVWVCVIIVCKMLYQLSVVDPDDYSRNCTMVRLFTGGVQSLFERTGCVVWLIPETSMRWCCACIYAAQSVQERKESGQGRRLGCSTLRNDKKVWLCSQTVTSRTSQ